MKPDAATGNRLDVVLCWHMHQPDYRFQDEYLRPWTWLHAIKDYTDMAAHLEQCAGACAVVNFSPVLILQLQDYARRIRASLDQGDAVGDLILDTLGSEPADLPLAAPTLDRLLRSLQRAHETRMRARFPVYSRLCDRAAEALLDGPALARRELDDLLVWYVLVWLGESVRVLPLVQRLQQQGSAFDLADRRALLQLTGEVIHGLLPRYRALADSGRVELSVTPYAHPILPLLLDIESAREAWHDIPLPQRAYPGGRERCDWHITEGLAVFEAAFGTRPVGCWPSEGAVSEATLELLARHGFRWVASGGQVLYHSLGHGDHLPQLAGWTLRDTAEPACFFRDEEISDRIGFQYSGWEAEAAVEDLVGRLEQRLQAWQSGPDAARQPVLSIIMDGENAWEYYAENGFAFLAALYRRLSTHPAIRLTTFGEALSGAPPRQLPRLVAGSWVYGTFSTWIGDPAKNRAWDLLILAKVAVDAALAPHVASRQKGDPEPGWIAAIWHQLAVCEASDWFWWLGTDNQLEDGPAFDQLFRQQLAELYLLIGMLPPAVLDEVINAGSVGLPGSRDGVAGAMRPGAEPSGA